MEFATVAFALYALAFMFLYAKGAAVSVEERHFCSAGLLLMPGVVHAFGAARARWNRIGTYAVLGVATAYGVASLAVHARYNLQLPLGTRGFRHQIASAPVLAFLRARFHDGSEQGNTVVYVPSPEIGLELPSGRVIPGQADFQTVEYRAHLAYHGRARAVYVVLQKRLTENGKSSALLASFKDYRPDAWRTIDLADFVCFVQQ